MNIVKIFPAILVMILLIAQGISAEMLITLDNPFTERWNNGRVILPGPGTMTIPKGPGILTLTISQDPFRRAGTATGPNQVQYQTFDQNESPNLGLFLGRTYYQNGIVFTSKQALTDGMAVFTKERYYSDTDTESPIRVQILPAIEVNTDHQLANRVTFEGNWEPFRNGRAADTGCDVYGSWNTTRGIVNISYTSGLFDLVTVKGDYWNNEKTAGSVEGTLQGPVLTGIWREGREGQTRSGRFTLFFRNDCCSFTGTCGTGESDSNLGDWSGVRR